MSRIKIEIEFQSVSCNCEHCHTGDGQLIIYKNEEILEKYNNLAFFRVSNDPNEGYHALIAGNIMLSLYNKGIITKDCAWNFFHILQEAKFYPNKSFELMIEY